MSNPYFRFKQFTVFHDKCAMKVGTDGVLLGAWTRVDNAAEVLDVGTGTGLVALMVAQRNPQARVVAIDLDGQAVEQAKENIGNSPFADRIAVELSDFRHYVQYCPKRFDLIVSNPPYFSDSLLPPDKGRAKARHSVSLTLDELLLSARNCLKDHGMLSLILPYDKNDELNRLCEKYAFHPKRKTVVYPLPNSEPKRLLIELALMPVVRDRLEERTGPLERDRPEERTGPESLVIESSRHCYTGEFGALVKDFYL